MKVPTPHPANATRALTWGFMAGSILGERAGTIDPTCLSLLAPAPTHPTEFNAKSDIAGTRHVFTASKTVCGNPWQFFGAEHSGFFDGSWPVKRPATRAGQFSVTQ